MRKTVLLLTAILITIAGSEIPAQTLYIPAAAHSAGVGGAQWRTDVEVLACGDNQASFTIELLRANQANPSPAQVSFTLSPVASRRYQDLLGSSFSYSGSAGLRLTATSGSIIANSRTYNNDPQGTYGQFIPAFPESEAISFGKDAALIHLSRSSSTSTGFRTNIGFLNINNQTTRVEVELYRAGGSLYGTLVYILQPFEYRQINDIFDDVGAGNVTDGFAIVRTTTAGGRFFAYASVVDNQSADPVYVSPAEIPEASPSGGDGLIADHYAAADFDDIPLSAITAAMNAFGEIYYGHTSHGSQIVTGLGMIENELSSHVTPNFIEVDEDLGHYGDLAWVTTTRNALALNPYYPMVVWSWCGGVGDNTVTGINAYLTAMDQLERDFPNVVFVYMTGHLEGGGPDDTLHQRNQQIRDYCEENGKVLFDFADIESYDPDGQYYPWESDWCDWCTTWCESHQCPYCDDCAHSQCMNCYQKGKAFWWMLARLSGWDG
jgi:hypothetical protein